MIKKERYPLNVPKNSKKARPFGLDCPICGAATPFFAFGPMSSQDFHKSNVCQACRTTLTLTLSTWHKILIALLVTIPVFLFTRIKHFCIYLAESEYAIRKHSELSGIPIAAITEVPQVIDPLSANN